MWPGLAYCEGSWESNSVPFAFEANALPLSHFPSPKCYLLGLVVLRTMNTACFFFLFLPQNTRMSWSGCLCPPMHTLQLKPCCDVGHLGGDDVALIND